MFKKSDTITQFGPPVLVIECVKCNRQGEMQLHTAVRRFGTITVDELVRRVAEEGGCPWVAKNSCTAFVQPTPVTFWAKLSDAQDNGWRPVLVCQRRHYLELRARCPQCASGGATIERILSDEESDPRLAPSETVPF